MVNASYVTTPALDVVVQEIPLLQMVVSRVIVPLSITKQKSRDVSKRTIHVPMATIMTGLGHKKTVLLKPSQTNKFAGNVILCVNVAKVTDSTKAFVWNVLDIKLASYAGMSALQIITQPNRIAFVTLVTLNVAVVTESDQTCVTNVGT